MSTLPLTDDQHAALFRLGKSYLITWMTLTTLGFGLFLYLTFVEKVPFRLAMLELGGSMLVRPTLFLIYQFRASHITGVPPGRSPWLIFLAELLWVAFFVGLVWVFF
jgi:hypothetical protein